MKEKQIYHNKEDIILNNKYINKRIILNRYMYKNEYDKIINIIINWCYKNGF